MRYGAGEEEINVVALFGWVGGWSTERGGDWLKNGGGSRYEVGNFVVNDSHSSLQAVSSTEKMARWQTFQSDAEFQSQAEGPVVKKRGSSFFPFQILQWRHS